MAALLSLFAASAFAATLEDVRKVESSLLVNGTIDITADGSVAGYTLKDSEKLPSGIKSMVARVVPQWRFEPTRLGEGATSVRAAMSLRFVAKELEDKTYAIAIRSAHFDNDQPGENPSARIMMPPKYPGQAALDGIGGTVYTIVRVGRDGRVEAVIAEQVNLRMVAGEDELRRCREMLADAALRAAKHWTFQPPTKGESVDAPYWLVRIPVDFVPWGSEGPKDHKWQAYVPGPRAKVTWRKDDAGTGVDAVAAGGVYSLDGGPRLLTSLDPS